MNLENYKTISFDIFDTLVSRRLYRPKDLFSLVQSQLSTMDSMLDFDEIIDNFSEIRIQAEVDAREHKVSSIGGEPEILISDIYNQISKRSEKITTQLIDSLIELEIECEKLVLYKCPKGEDLFNRACQSGAKVVLISDMYLASETLREILISCGYDVDNIHIFSSGEEGYSKHSGALYSIVSKKLNINDKSWLHIGDNKHADIANAEKFGISSMHADWSEYSHDRSYHWKSKDVIGDSLNKSLHLKQASNYYNNTLSEIGFKIFGPLMLGYISWLTTQLKNSKIDKALFLARDAHLIHKIYKKYFTINSVESEYIYLSRASTYMLGLTDWPMHRIWHLFGGKNRKSLKKILSVVGLDAKDFLSDIHDVGFPDENYVPTKGEEHKVHWLINKLFQQVLIKNTSNRENFADYFKKACADKQNIALIDVGWMGNIQSVFARSLGDQWAKKNISGFYLATFQGANDNKSLYNNMLGWLTNYGHPHDKQDMILSGGVELMEFAMADNTGSTLGYVKTVDGIAPLRDTTSDSEQDYLRKAALLQQGILSFFEYISPLLSTGHYQSFDSIVLSEPFFQLINSPTSQQLEALSTLTHAEAAGSNAERLALVSKISIKNRLFPGPVYQEALHNSYWKEGFKRLNRKKFWAK
ncbi:HAD family hydrolase [Rosenbergiella nectarea]|uniref:HAD family hydrolase n=1 Tax=Rosenbergiella nectarea TaxID=988801 RepID=UPI001F4EF54A|nr:HAD-IA family hydrolase [Rosenbergiella nectarea]